jgi:hypothetical protein
MHDIGANAAVVALVGGQCQSFLFREGVLLARHLLPDLVVHAVGIAFPRW